MKCVITVISCSSPPFSSASESFQHTIRWWCKEIRTFCNSRPDRWLVSDCWVSVLLFCFYQVPFPFGRFVFFSRTSRFPAGHLSARFWLLSSFPLLILFRASSRSVLPSLLDFDAVFQSLLPVFAFAQIWIFPWASCGYHRRAPGLRRHVILSYLALS